MRPVAIKTTAPACSAALAATFSLSGMIRSGPTIVPSMSRTMAEYVSLLAIVQQMTVKGHVTSVRPMVRSDQAKRSCRQARQNQKLLG